MNNNNQQRMTGHRLRLLITSKGQSLFYDSISWGQISNLSPIQGQSLH